MNRRGLATLGLVVAASLSVQVSAILAHTLFDRLGAAGVSGLRFAFAAVIALAIVRPRLRGRSAATCATIVLFGTSMASMNAFLYLALERLPLGIALTLEFLGPFALAVAGARRPRAIVFPVVGFVGVVLVVRPSGDLDVGGVALGLVAAASLAAYALLAERVGRATRGFDGLALALVVAAVLMAPFGASALPAVVGGDVVILVGSAVLGIVVAFAADYVAVKISSARTVAVLFSFDPVLAAVLGALVLGQSLDHLTVGGIVLVAVAGGVSAALAGVPAAAPLPTRHVARRRRRVWRPRAMAVNTTADVPRSLTSV
ncbi:DMT family transporter [Microbacterium sp. 179-I 3D2 NHS]|uniref:EamA family transporter n=1 Tax=Microbacterium sp. 179-I 3D2 NHS TaxID=3235178 RepID=UPI0039A1F726